MRSSGKKISVITLFVLAVGGMSNIGFGVTPNGKGVLTISGEIGAGQKNAFTVRKCAWSEHISQERVSCEVLPYKLRINEPVLLDQGVYSIHGPHNVSTGSQKLGIIIRDGEQKQLPLKRISIPRYEGVRFRVFVDLSNPSEFRKMARGIWSSKLNRRFLERSCAQSDSFSQYVCGSWDSSDSLNGAMMQTDSEANHYFISPKALSEMGMGFRMVNLGRVPVNDVADTGTFVSVLPGVYGIEYIHANGSTEYRYGLVVN